MQRQWSVWDELNLDYPPPANGLWRSDLRVHACQERTRIAKLDHEPLRREVERRREAWWVAVRSHPLCSRRYGDAPLWTPGLPLPTSKREYLYAPVLVVLAVIGVATAVAGFWPLAFVSFGITVGVIARAAGGEQQVKALNRLLVTNTCAYCRYAFGPRAPEDLPACPECGEPWPLIPPPAELAVELSASGKRSRRRR